MEVICPCCETKLQVDKKTGEVIWEEKKEKPMPSLLDMVNELEADHVHEVDIHDQLLELGNDARPGLKQPIPQRGD